MVTLPGRSAADEALLAKIKAPTYFFWGENDPAGGADTARPRR
jgi:hypothetical protein